MFAISVGCGSVRCMFTLLNQVIIYIAVLNGCEKFPVSMYTGSELDMTRGRLISVSPTLVCSMFVDCCCSFEQVS